MKDFKNILRGDYPDPSILRVDGDYYLVASTFLYSPALTIWHSQNLHDWTPLCHAVHGFTGDVYAPDLCRHNGRFFIYYPADGTNFVVYADQIEGPWSAPIDLKIPHIDPGHIVGEDGKRYLYLSQGHCVQLADDGLSVVGDIVKRYNGWPIPTDWQVECFALEAPKLFFKDGFYYMLSAEGGTSGPATSHMVVAARSKSVFGPWEESPHNPIIHTNSDEEKWWSQGHGSMFDTPGGDWYIVYHGYEKGYHTLGRQTLLSKINWTDDGWFYAEEIEHHDQFDAERQEFVELSDPMTADKLPWQWRFLGAYDADRLAFSDHGMTMTAKATNVADTVPLLVTPYSKSYELQVTVQLHGDVQAGLCLYYNPQAYAHVGVTVDQLSYSTMANPRVQPLSMPCDQMYLKLTNIKNMVTFYYSSDQQHWTKLIPTKDVSGFHHNTFNGFMSLKAGIYTIGDGSATFRNFVYRHID